MRVYNVPGREYYAERHQSYERENMGLDMLKKLVLNVYKKLEKKYYFQLAIGKNCFSEEVIGEWGYDIEAFFFEKFGRRDIWPFPQYLPHFEEALLFSLIELLYDYVTVPTKTYNDTHYNCGIHVLEGDKEQGKQEYRENINDLLKNYQDGFELTLEGTIQRIPPSGLVRLIEKLPKTADPDNINIRVQTAVKTYLRYSSTLMDKKGVLLELGNVLDFLEESKLGISKKDDSDLFRILNNFDLRHFRQAQSRDYSSEIWYDWFFFTFLASIDTRLRFAEKKE